MGSANDLPAPFKRLLCGVEVKFRFAMDYSEPITKELILITYALILHKLRPAIRCKIFLHMPLTKDSVSSR